MKRCGKADFFIATAKAVRTPDGYWNPDGEVFSPGVPSLPSPPCTAGWGAVPCYISQQSTVISVRGISHQLTVKSSLLILVG
jgi:hypothetical protein